MRAARAALFALALAANPANAQLRGHGGPARAVAATPDGTRAASASFDSSVIVWDLATGQALGAARPHDAPATAVAANSDRFATGDQDGRVAIWRLGAPPILVAAHREAPVAALAATPDGAGFLSAGWDGRLIRIDAGSGAMTLLDDAKTPLSGVCADGAGAVVGEQSGRVRWISGGAASGETQAGAPILSMACKSGRVFAGLADGRVIEARRAGGATLFEMPGPVSALAVRDRRVVAGAMTGAIRVFERGAARDLAAKVGRPVWGLALTDDEALAAGDDGFVRRYDFASGREKEPAEFAVREEAPESLRDHPGARVFMACRACHSLKPGENRAGPTLAGVIGRRIATASGYAYSGALKRMDIVWTAEAVARMFEIGPSAMTPGTKMPEQRVTDEADRAALVDFIARATMKR